MQSKEMLVLIWLQFFQGSFCKTFISIHVANPASLSILQNHWEMPEKDSSPSFLKWGSYLEQEKEEKHLSIWEIISKKGVLAKYKIK